MKIKKESEEPCILYPKKNNKEFDLKLKKALFLVCPDMRLIRDLKELIIQYLIESLIPFDDDFPSSKDSGEENGLKKIGYNIFVADYKKIWSVDIDQYVYGDELATRKE
jgi:hypothetical protein